MTIEEQLHAVVHLLEQTAQMALRNEQTCKRLFEAAEVHSRSLGTLTETVTILGNKLIMLTEAHSRLTDAHTGLAEAHNRLAGAHNHLTEEIAGYVADGRERMKQMEANLDALIRIITAEHSNGKGKA